MSSLPQGWASATLGEVTAPRGEKANPSDLGDLPFVGLEEVEAHTGRIIRTQTTAGLKSAVSLFGKGDLLYGRLRPYLNKVALAENDGAASAEFIVFPPSVALDQSYLQRTLMSPEFVQFTGLRSTGDRPRVSFDAVSDYMLPLPPLAEQQRIVARIDSLTGKSGRARDHLDHIPRLVEKYKQAVLAAAFRGDLTREWRREQREGVLPEPTSGRTGKLRRGIPEAVRETEFVASWIRPEAWSCDHVGRYLIEGVLLDVKDGNHGTNHPKREEFSSVGLPFITAAQLEGDILNALTAPRLEGEPLRKLNVGFARPNDVLLSHKGTVGRAAICTEDCVLSPQTTYYRANQSLFSPEFLRLQFLSPFFVSQLDAVKSQTTRDFVPISGQYELFLLRPSLREQREIVRLVEFAFTWIDRLASEATSARRLIDRLDQAVLAKAFRGELVPQDPEDEPASALLDRIKAERGAAPKAIRGRKARGLVT